jgi:hypothetical protein
MSDQSTKGSSVALDMCSLYITRLIYNVSVLFWMARYLHIQYIPVVFSLQ